MGFFDAFDVRARRALYFGRCAAIERNTRVIEPAHLLLGILREGDDTISELLRRHQLDAAEVCRTLEADTTFDTAFDPAFGPAASAPEPPLSEASKRILECAAQEAAAMRHATVGCDHLLLGVLSVEGSAAGSHLRRLGLAINRLRRDIASLRNEGYPRRAGPISSR